LELRARFRADIGQLLATVEVLVMPTTPAPAPSGLDSTGDPSFCAPWSFAGLPAISLPSGLTPDGLPMAIQLVAGPEAELRLLAAARWCEQVIGFHATPYDEVKIKR
ncbi:MAG: amidase family protein, partial [bacterium]